MKRGLFFFIQYLASSNQDRGASSVWGEASIFTHLIAAITHTYFIPAVIVLAL
jgi:hypothetical protein